MRRETRRVTVCCSCWSGRVTMRRASTATLPQTPGTYLASSSLSRLRCAVACPGRRLTPCVPRKHADSRGPVRRGGRPLSGRRARRGWKEAVSSSPSMFACCIETLGIKHRGPTGTHEAGAGREQVTHAALSICWIAACHGADVVALHRCRVQATKRAYATLLHVRQRWSLDHLHLAAQCAAIRPTLATGHACQRPRLHQSIRCTTGPLCHIPTPLTCGQSGPPPLRSARSFFTRPSTNPGSPPVLTRSAPRSAIRSTTSALRGKFVAAT